MQIRFDQRSGQRPFACWSSRASAPVSTSCCLRLRQRRGGSGDWGCGGTNSRMPAPSAAMRCCSRKVRATRSVAVRKPRKKPAATERACSLMRHTAFVGLAAIWKIRQPIAGAFADLDALPGTRLVARSSLYRSARWGIWDQPDFVNADRAA